GRGPLRRAPASAVAGHLDVALGAYEDAGPLARQLQAADGLERGGEEARLLAEGLLEVARREAQALERQAHLACGASRLAGAEGVDAARRACRVGDLRTDADDGDLGTLRRMDGQVGTERRPLLDEEVRVVAAEAEGADGRAARTVRLPRLRAAQGAEGDLPEDRVQGLDLRRGRQGLVAHRRQHLLQASDAGHRDEVAEVRLERADGPRRGGVAIDRIHAAQLGCVAELRARGVALDVLHLGGGPARLRERALHRPRLPALGRREQTTAAAVVRQADAANHTEDSVAVP